MYGVLDEIDEERTTTTRLLGCLEVVTFELQLMENILASSPEVRGKDRSIILRDLLQMRERSQKLLDWLAEQRLEVPAM